MEFKVLSESDEKIVFTTKSVGVSLLNSLRRTIISELPAFAIDEVSFYENNSPLFNEYIANRLALIPLTFDETVSDDAVITFELNVEATDCIKTVYSSEFKSTDALIKTFCEHIPIIKLGKNQRLRLEATAVKSNAKQHAKFQSALASYSALPDFKVSNKCDKCGECIKACPKKIITENINLSNDYECLLCESCVETCPKTALTVIPKENEYVFFIESYNNLTARQQLMRALDSMDSGIKKLEKELK